MNKEMRLFTRSDVERLLDIGSCIEVVEDAFRKRGSGDCSPSRVLGIHVVGGGFHAKAAVLEVSRPYFAVKVNANFPANPARHGLPTIQGVLVFFDATNGVPLAIMDSMSITRLRTAAASAVAAKFLARTNAHTAAFVGCGVQARAHVAAISTVRDLKKVFLFDSDPTNAVRFAVELRGLYSFIVVVADELREATLTSDIIVTATSSTAPFVGVGDVGPGAFVAAVGADNEHKQEIEIALLRASAIVVDDIEQCATIGDLHHALAVEALQRSNVRATLSEVVAGKKVGRLDDEEILVFDSTGVAIEDVAAAAFVFERGLREGAGMAIPLEV